MKGFGVQGEVMHGNPHCHQAVGGLGTCQSQSGEGKVRADLGVQWERLGGADLWQMVMGVPEDEAVRARGGEPHSVVPLAPFRGFSHHR